MVPPGDRQLFKVADQIGGNGVSWDGFQGLKRRVSNWINRIHPFPNPGNTAEKVGKPGRRSVLNIAGYDRGAIKSSLRLLPTGTRCAGAVHGREQQLVNSSMHFASLHKRVLPTSISQ